VADGEEVVVEGGKEVVDLRLKLGEGMKWSREDVWWCLRRGTMRMRCALARRQPKMIDDFSAAPRCGVQLVGRSITFGSIPSASYSRCESFVAFVYLQPFDHCTESFAIMTSFSDDGCLK